MDEKTSNIVLGIIMGVLFAVPLTYMYVDSNQPTNEEACKLHAIDKMMNYVQDPDQK